MKRFSTLLLLLSALLLTSTAQTARRVTATLSADGKARLEGFLPTSPTGRAIVDCPGGGYQNLSMQNEGYDWAEFFNRQGIAFFVLTYRMPGGNRSIPMGDACQAMRTVRDSAQVWGINPMDVGIMGFSAGGHLASTIATHAELAERPDFQILFYPVISMVERESHKGSVNNFLGNSKSDETLVKDFSNYNRVRVHQTPPAILLMSADDRVVPPLTNGIRYYEALRRQGVPVAMYVYPSGGHGFGFRSNYAYHEQMKQELSTWLRELKAPRPDAIRVACIGNSITDGFGIDMAAVNSYPAQLQRLLGDGYAVRNFGVSARTLLNKGDLPYMNEPQWRDAQQFQPDVVIIKLGTNDSKPENWQHSADFEQDLTQMITTLRPDLAQKPKKGKKGQVSAQRPRIYLATPIPAFKPTWNINDSVIVNGIIPVIQRVAKQYQLDIIDLHTLYADDGDKMLSDGIHPDARGARRIAEIIANIIKQ